MTRISGKMSILTAGYLQLHMNVTLETNEPIDTGGSSSTSSASETSFNPGTSGLTSTNVEAAIKEVNSKTTKTAADVSYDSTLNYANSTVGKEIKTLNTAVGNSTSGLTKKVSDLELLTSEEIPASGTLVDNTTYNTDGGFTMSSTLTPPTDNSKGIIINNATIASGFGFVGNYVGDTPTSGSTYMISVINGVWCFNEVYSQTNA